jgi:hypothetical protein
MNGEAMDTKLKADIAESEVITELLSRGFNVLRPVGDRLPYDLAVDYNGKLIRIQVKHAWYNQKDEAYVVDVRRTKTNRRQMIRARYSMMDFDFAVVYIGETKVFYIMPIAIFNSFASTISFIEGQKRQRPPQSLKYRNNWALIGELAVTTYYSIANT